MFGAFNTNLTGLDKGMQVKVANLLSDRAAYMRLSADLTDRKAALLSNPTEAAEQELAEFASVVVAPARLKVAEQVTELLKEAVDIDKLQGMLPMLVMGVMTAVNVPLLLNIIGLDPDMISEIAAKGKEFFQRDDS